MPTQDRNYLVTGALGQIGSELVPALRARYGAERVPSEVATAFPTVLLEVTLAEAAIFTPRRSRILLR